MESGSMAADSAPATERPGDWGAGEKGLKSNAIGFVSNVVIATASTAPAYSLAATLGFIVAVPGVGLSAPGRAAGLVPADALHRVRLQPDEPGRPGCGDELRLGDPGDRARGRLALRWAIIAADIIVMASLAQIAGSYTFLLVGWQAAADSALGGDARGLRRGSLLMTWICLVGIELNALDAEDPARRRARRSSRLFAVVALVKVCGDAAGTSYVPRLGLVNPFHLPSCGRSLDGVLLGLFIYWGWDSGVAVNEESENKDDGPGRAAVLEHPPAPP